MGSFLVWVPKPHVHPSLNKAFRADRFRIFSYIHGETSGSTNAGPLRPRQARIILSNGLRGFCFCFFPVRSSFPVRYVVCFFIAFPTQRRGAIAARLKKLPGVRAGFSLAECGT